MVSRTLLTHGMGLACLMGVAACGSDDGGDDSAEADDTAGETGETGDTGDPDAEAPLKLSPDLCEDPSNMDVLLASPGWSALAQESGFNADQLQRMVENPTDGPFYMVNLIRYREWAVYPDGRDTDLTGREANALYAPLEFLEAIGAGVVFNADVDDQIDGADDEVWETVSLVEYPCPVAFFAMLMDPAFQERAIHKQAGVERTTVMPTNLTPWAEPGDPDQSEAMFPPSEQDPAFDLVRVMDFDDVAQYEPGSEEPERTGEEAWELYQEAEAPVSMALGHYSTAVLEVQGVLSGDERTFDEVQIVRMSSIKGFQALLDDPDREAAEHHRVAALSENYSMITFPQLSNIPNGGDGGGGGSSIPVTPDGLGVVCETDADCTGEGANKCISDGGGIGFCSFQGCGAGECAAPYLCCRECNEAAAGNLPFEGSACFPDTLTSPLTAEPISCTCD